MNIFLWVYRFLYCIAHALLPLVSLGHAKLRIGYRMRKSKDGVLPWLDFSAKQKPIWVHCSSGEFEYAKPVIREIKQRWPERKILVTYFSPSMHGIVQKNHDVDMACPSPWDEPSVIKDFIAHHQPSCFLLSRTDIWPEVLYQCQRAQIPTLLFSATLAEQSRRNQPFVRAFYTWAMGLLRDIYCVDEADHKVFQTMGLVSQIAGDTRYDQVIARLKENKPIASGHFAHHDRQKIIVAGSTWHEDEEVLIPAFAKMAQKGNWFLVIAPHEPTAEHLADLKQTLRQAHVSFSLYSEAFNQPTQVLIVDKVGVLAELYQRAQFAVVGGSFRKTVHSVMEPLAAGCITLLGPKHLNNREAISFQNISVAPGLSPVQVVTSAHEMHDQLILLSQRTDLSVIQHSIATEIQKRSGKSRIVVDWIAKVSP